ncbi:MAG: AI-2E family transporter [Clostridia bacterium]|nr:AI-2E family transporter [Clostridia bacterium]
MKIKFDKKYLKYSLYAFLTITLSIIVFKIIYNIDDIFRVFATFFNFIFKLLAPFIIGFFIAYILNPGVRYLEKNVFFQKRPARILSIITVYLIVFGTVTLISISVVPRLAENIANLIDKIPGFAKEIEKMVLNFVSNPVVNKYYDVNFQLNNIIDSYTSNISEFLQVTMSDLIKGVLSVTSGVINTILGFIIAFYMLNDKEKFINMFNKLLQTMLEDSVIDNLNYFVMEVNEIFSKFIVGKALDSFIIGILCLIGLLIMKIEFALLISVIVAITNMIPYFGPFIGAVPAVILALFDGPIYGVWVALFILALQQFDGLILGPKILGDSVGLSPFWVIFSIIVGGGLFGVLGMFLGVPAMAVVRLVISKLVNKRIKAKKSEQSGIIT